MRHTEANAVRGEPFEADRSVRLTDSSDLSEELEGRGTLPSHSISSFDKLRIGLSKGELLFFVPSPLKVEDSTLARRGLG